MGFLLRNLLLHAFLSLFSLAQKLKLNNNSSLYKEMISIKLSHCTTLPNFSKYVTSLQRWGKLDWIKACNSARGSISQSSKVGDEIRNVSFILEWVSEVV